MGLAEVFAEAAERVKQLTEAPSNEDQLELYANFKQANVGDCNTPRPGLFAMKEKAKWDAWNAVKGTSKDDAMKTYVAKVDSLCGTSLSSKI
jgi:diazepam-binding inhibitor (GABA receptor modulator, acyl-CoA-binding protein)